MNVYKKERKKRTKFCLLFVSTCHRIFPVKKHYDQSAVVPGKRVYTVSGGLVEGHRPWGPAF